MLAADTETALIRRALLVPPLVCVSYATSEGEADVVLYKDAKPLCEELFSGKSLWANAPFDLAVIGNQFPELIPLIFDALQRGDVYDILLRQKLIDIAHGRYFGFYPDPETGKTLKITYSVAAVAKRLLGLDMSKGDDTYRLRYAELRETPVEDWPKEAYDYAALDSEVLWPIYNIQEEQVEVLGSQGMQVCAAMALHLMSAWGIRTDSKAIEELDERTFKEWEEIGERMKENGLIHNRGARNTKLAKKLLIESVGVENCKLTLTGAKKLSEDYTHEDAVADGYVKLDEESCEASGNPILKDYARFGSLIKLRSTYVSMLWKGVKYPIQGRYEPIRETGRTSSFSPNLQNLPREPGVRECFVPRDGNVFIFSDYSLAELCSLAQKCIEVIGYSRLADRLNAGFDPHTDMAAQIMGITYEEAAALKKAGDKHFKEMRTLAKAADFGFPGALGPDSFIDFAKAAYGVVLTREQAVDLKAKWFEAWPEMREYFAWIDSLMGEDNRAWIMDPVTKFYRGNVKYTVCANTFFQSRSAFGSKAALWEVCRRQYAVSTSPLYGTHTIAFVHDEIGIEAPEERAHEAALELEKVMVEEFTKYHPDLADAVAASPSISRRWYKEVPQVWACTSCGHIEIDGKASCVKCGSDARLIPWEDRHGKAA